jgi:hypothetical protein
MTIPFHALADPAVRNVQVNIHNNTDHFIEIKSFESSRIFASTRIGEAEIGPQTSEFNAVFFTSFDKEPIHAGINILLDDKLMKLMWQINMGPGGPDDFKAHLCGVVKDPPRPDDQSHCDIPYVEGSILFVDFYLE